MDFTEHDNPSVFPMYVTKGGQSFGFCPGKATWDSEVMLTFKMLIVATETGCHYNAGGLEDQPQWWIDTLSWFIPRYKDAKFASRVRSVVGDSKAQGVLSNGGNNGRPSHSAAGRR
jgi:hypothetical protein